MNSKEFLDRLFPPGTNGLIEFRALKEGEEPRRWFTSMVTDRDIEKMSTLSQEGFGIYFGIATRRNSSSGERDNLLQTMAVGIDIDEVPEGYAPPEAKASLVVHTSPAGKTKDGKPHQGHYHLYYVLAEPLDVSTEDGCRRYERVARAIIARYDGDPATEDAERILKVPGFPNPENGHVVSVIKDRPVALAWDDLELVFPPLPEFIDEKKPSRAADVILSGQTEGGRNNAVASVAGKLRNHLPLDDTLELVRAWNVQKNTPPLPNDELEKTVRGIYQRYSPRDLDLAAQVREALLRVRSRINEVSPESAVDAMLSEALQLVPESRQVVWSDQAGPMFDERLEETLAGTGKPQGIATPWGAVNKLLLGGLHRGWLYSVTANTSDCKTVLMTQIARHAAKGGKRIFYVSTEMDVYSLWLRTLSAMTGVPAGSLFQPEVPVEGHLRSAVRDAHRALIQEGRMAWLNIARVNSAQIFKAAMRVKEERGLDLACVDHIHQMTDQVAEGSQAIKFAEITNGLKGMADSLEIPVVMGAQQNRAGRAGAGMEHIRASGGIEEGSDVVMVLERPDKGKGLVPEKFVLRIEKNRNGPSDRAADLLFDAPAVRILEKEQWR